jgi:hypothetical protein
MNTLNFYTVYNVFQIGGGINFVKQLKKEGNYKIHLHNILMDKSSRLRTILLFFFLHSSFVQLP